MEQRRNDQTLEDPDQQAGPSTSKDISVLGVGHRITKRPARLQSEDEDTQSNTNGSDEQQVTKSKINLSCTHS